MRVELALRNRDIDLLGHVNQAVFHELLEDARAAFFAEVVPELPFDRYVLARAELDYKHEIRFADRTVIGECRVGALGRSRIELENRLLLTDGTVAAEGRAILVAWDPEARRSRPLSDGERQALAGE